MKIVELTKTINFGVRHKFQHLPQFDSTFHVLHFYVKINKFLVLDITTWTQSCIIYHH